MSAVDQLQVLAHQRGLVVMARRVLDSDFWTWELWSGLRRVEWGCTPRHLLERVTKPPAPRLLS